MDPSSVPALNTLVSQGRLDEIQSLAKRHTSEDLSSEEGISLGVIVSKEERGHIHIALRLAYPQLKSISAKNVSGETELCISADRDYWRLRDLLEHDEVIRLLRFVHTAQMSPSQSYLLPPDPSKDHRTKVHRLLDDIFGSKMVARTLTVEGRPKRRRVEAHPAGGEGEEATRIMMRFRKHTSKGTGKGDNSYLKFVMKKTNLEHQEAIQRLCSSLHIQPSQFSCAGIKDRRAITFQYMTARSVTMETMKSLDGECDLYPELQTGSYQYVPHPLRLGNLSGNEFVVTVRDVALATPVPGGGGVEGVVEAGAVRVRERGFVNYFGPQRFGYQGVLRGVLSPHVGLAMLKGDCMSAVKLLLYPELGEACDKSGDPVHAAKLYFQSTHDVSGTLERMPPSRRREGYILRALRRHGFTETGCQHSLMSIPHSLRLLYVHSLSSLLWNHLVSHRLQEYGERVVEGDLILRPSQEKTLRECVHVLTSLEASSGHYSIGDVVLPMVGTGTVFPGNRTAEKLQQMLSELGLTLDSFRLRHFGMHIAGSYRKMVACPRHMTWEWLDGRSLRLHFTLNPSCYATMLLGELSGGGVATHTVDQSDVDEEAEDNSQSD